MKGVSFMEVISITKINFNNVDMNEAISISENFVKSNKQLVVFTPNVEIAYQCYFDEKLLNIINSANLILPDGDGIIKASKKIGYPLKEKVAGVDYGYNLLKILSDNNYPLFLLGGTENSVTNAKTNLESSIRGLNVAGFHNGYFDKEGEINDQVIEMINNSGAKALYVCFGFPSQEIWVYNNINKLKNVKVIVCLGGSIDIYSGKAKRAPNFYRKLHLEWLYRTIKEPRRIKRIMVIPKYFKIINEEKKKK